MTVPCGKCFICRLKRQSNWTIRVLHELHTSDNKACWWTLTYDDEHVPKTDEGFLTLKKRDLQLFIKLVRRLLDVKGIKRKIKYFASGEYGDNPKSQGENRPHYHCIIIGIDFSEMWFHDTVRKAWRNGYASPGTVTKDSIKYTARYIQKKIISKNENFLYGYYTGREPEFQIQSKGIGRVYLESVKERIEKTGKLLYKTKEISIPKYYWDKCEISYDVREKLLQEQYDELNDNGLEKEWEGLFKYNPLGLSEYNDRLKMQKEQIAKNIKARMEIKKSRQNGKNKL